LHPDERGDGSIVNVGTFLLSFVVCNFKYHVFEVFGDLEKQVHESSMNLLDSFELICSEIHKSDFLWNIQIISRGFSILLQRFVGLYVQWKVKDQDYVMDKIKLKLLNLYYRQERLVPGDPNYTSHERFFTQQIQYLRTKLRSISGSDEELSKFDVARATDTLQIQEAFYLDHFAYWATIFGRKSIHIAHEILLDSNFQFTDLRLFGERLGFDIMVDMYESNYWKGVLQDLMASPPCFDKAFQVFLMIQDSFQHFSTNESFVELKRSVDAMFSKKDTSSLTSKVASIIRLMKIVQTQQINPERREECEGLISEVEIQMMEANATPEMMTCALQKLLKCVNFIPLDQINVNVKRVVHVILEHGIEYEKQSFARKIHTRMVTTDRVGRAIEKAVGNVVGLVPDGLDALKKLKNFTDFRELIDEPLLGMCYSTFACELISGPMVTHESMPETLLFDVKRIHDYQRRLIYLSKVICIGIRLKHYYNCHGNECGMRPQDELSSKVFLFFSFSFFLGFNM